MVHVSWGIILAVGKGQQLASGAETAFLGVGSRPLLGHVMMAYEQCGEIEGVVVVADRERIETVRAMGPRLGCTKLQAIVPGFQARRACLNAGLKALPEDATIVTIQEVSRPCVTADMIASVVKAAKRYGNGVTAARVEDTVVEAAKGMSGSKTFAAQSLWALQSPQSFRRDLLERALQAADKKKVRLEDEAAGLQLVGESVRMVPCAGANLRIRTPDDLGLAAQLLP